MAYLKSVRRYQNGSPSWMTWSLQEQLQGCSRLRYGMRAQQRFRFGPWPERRDRTSWLLRQFVLHQTCNGQTGCQPRRLNTKQVYQPRDAVLLGAINPEIKKTALCVFQLGSYARIRRLKSLRLDTRPPLPYARHKGMHPLRIDTVILPFYPFYIRSKACLAGKIEGEMNTQPTRLGNRINQVAERMTTAVTEIDSPGEPLHRFPGIGKPLPTPGERHRTQACSINKGSRLHP